MEWKDEGSYYTSLFLQKQKRGLFRGFTVDFSLGKAKIAWGKNLQLQGKRVFQPQKRWWPGGPQTSNLHHNLSVSQIVFQRVSGSKKIFVPRKLVGGFSPTQFEKDAHQNGNLPQIGGRNFKKKHLKPPFRRFSLLE